MSAEQIREAVAEVEGLIVYQRGEADSVKLMREKWGWTRARTKKVIQAIYRSWHKQDEANRKVTKSQAIRRLETNMRLARAKGQFAAVAAMETQLAKIQGTEVPIAIKVDAVLGPIVGNVLAGMDVEMMAAMAAQYDALQQAVKQLPAPKKLDVMDGEVVSDEAKVYETSNPQKTTPDDASTGVAKATPGA